MPIHNGLITDPSGSFSPDGLIAVGAFFAIEVHVPPEIAEVLTQQGQPIPTPVSGFALIDTGATLTCVHERALLDLGLNPVGTVNSGTAHGQVQQSLYPARIVFPAQGWTVDIGSVAGVDLSGQVLNIAPSPQRIIALIGRNFLKQCVLVWNGTNGSWTICFR